MTGPEQNRVRHPTDGSMSIQEAWGRGFIAIVLLFIFLVGVKGMGDGFQGLGKDLLESFFRATENPFVGLVIGILGTTLVQSSSISTSMIVAMVAAPGNPLPVESAVPMIMGANIGTTVTNTIVSLGHIGRPEEFRRAFSAATCHDFFNFMAVAVLLPLELVTGFLSRPAGYFAGYLAIKEGAKLPNPIKAAASAGLAPIEAAIEALFPNPLLAAVIMIAVSVAMLFFALTMIVRNLRKLAATRLEVYINRALGGSAMIAIVVGIIVTVMVQSSSITTSVLVPLAGAGVITLRQAFPVTLGANIGTTVTALLASMAASEEMAYFAVQIALVHLFFNLTGTALVYPVRAIRDIPIRLAEWLANIAVRSKHYALLYVLLLFYGVPAALIGISRLF